MSTESDERLLQLISVKKSIEEIAKVQKRSVSCIKSRLKVLAADMYFNQKLPYEQVEARTGIKKDDIIIKRQKIPAISEDKEPKVEPEAGPEREAEALQEQKQEQEQEPLVTKATVTTVTTVTREIVTQTEPTTDLNTQNTPLAIISTLILSTIADCLSPNR